MWSGYKNFNHYFTIDEKTKFFEEIEAEEITMVKTNRGVQYLNIPASFDIETSSFKDDTNKKHALMYSWAVCINGSTIFGRTWNEFLKLCSDLQDFFDLDPDKRILIMYVHNLGYEFQFMRKRFIWESGKVFSIKERRPIYALSTIGIEFRCSYILSNYSLAYIGSSLLTKYKVTKKVGDLDYSKVRHPWTPMTKKEIEYQLDDVRVVCAYIQEKIEHDGSILKIPLTNTGYVRRYCAESCLKKVNGKKTNFNYRVLMKNLMIESEKEYTQLKSVFQGGFTHANPFYSDETLYDVGSADLTSDYPFQMVAEYFPMSRGAFIGEVHDEKLFKKLLKKYCCIFTASISQLTPTFRNDNYISVSHCDTTSKDVVVQNGRVVCAEYVQLSCTELDWDIIDKTYEWDSVEICNMRIYQRGYLPRELVLSILELYKNKTTLKGVDDKVIEYMVSKNMINACYGMAVTNIVRDDIQYDDFDEWKKDSADAVSQLIQYNKNFNRFLSYAWGVWVTAHARHMLWDAILEFGDDYVYSDTDSIKGINFEKHLTYFKLTNMETYGKLAKMCEYQNIPLEMIKPKTIEGVEKVIGYWDIEEPYNMFKTIGAKRYIYEHKSGEFLMTVSGVDKYKAIPYMLYEYGGEEYHTEEWLKIFQQAYDMRPEFKKERKEALKKVIEESRKENGLSYFRVTLFFTENLYIPAEYSGKQTLTYIDNEDEFYVTDYLGETRKCKELSSIHMEPGSYSFSIADTYKKYLQDIKIEAI